MEIFGVEVNPYELFLILILLLGATGSFDEKNACKSGIKDHLPKQTSGSPVRILDASHKPLTINPFGSMRLPARPRLYNPRSFSPNA